MPLTIAQNLQTLMIREGRQLVWAGHPDLLLEAYIASGGTVSHPRDRIVAALTAARRSKLFKHAGYLEPAISKVNEKCFILALR